MAKKLDAVFKSTIKLNQEKGGAWMASIEKSVDGYDSSYEISAWKNASAAKKWVKSKVLDMTPRKSIKMEVTKKDLNDKPVELKGELTFKVDA